MGVPPPPSTPKKHMLPCYHAVKNFSMMIVASRYDFIRNVEISQLRLLLLTSTYSSSLWKYSPSKIRILAKPVATRIFFHWKWPVIYHLAVGPMIILTISQNLLPLQSFGKTIWAAAKIPADKSVWSQAFLPRKRSLVIDDRFEE